MTQFNISTRTYHAADQKTFRHVFNVSELELDPVTGPAFLRLRDALGSFPQGRYPHYYVVKTSKKRGFTPSAVIKLKAGYRGETTDAEEWDMQYIETSVITAKMKEHLVELAQTSIAMISAHEYDASGRKDLAGRWSACSERHSVFDGAVEPLTFLNGATRLVYDYERQNQYSGDVPSSLSDETLKRVKNRCLIIKFRNSLSRIESITVWFANLANLAASSNTSYYYSENQDFFDADDVKADDTRGAFSRGKTIFKTRIGGPLEEQPVRSFPDNEPLLGAIKHGVHSKA